MGFSWAINGCPGKSDIESNFKQMKQFGARYVRLYGACDRGSFNDDLVDAAYSTGMGVYYLVWFGCVREIRKLPAVPQTPLN